jgi:hypothetical protein
MSRLDVPEDAAYSFPPGDRSRQSPFPILSILLILSRIPGPFSYGFGSNAGQAVQLRSV